MDKRHLDILDALKSLGGQATTNEISNILGWSHSQVSQILGHMERIECLDKTAHIRTWKLIPNSDNTPRKKAIRKTFIELGNQATTAQIAEKLNLNINGVSQTIGSMKGLQYINGKAGQTRWKNTQI